MHSTSWRTPRPSSRPRPPVPVYVSSLWGTTRNIKRQTLPCASENGLAPYETPVWRSRFLKDHGLGKQADALFELQNGARTMVAAIVHQCDRPRSPLLARLARAAPPAPHRPPPMITSPFPLNPGPPHPASHSAPSHYPPAPLRQV